MNTEDQKIISILEQATRIAIVGISEKPERPSFEVASYLRNYYEIIPVNPGLSAWQEFVCYPSLSDIPPDLQPDIVDIFRRSEEVLPIVKGAQARGIKTIWMQLGVINDKAAEFAQREGINVIMNRCLKIEHSKAMAAGLHQRSGSDGLSVSREQSK